MFVAGNRANTAYFPRSLHVHLTELPETKLVKIVIGTPGLKTPSVWTVGAELIRFI